jgi:hypothetical protein
MALEDQTAEIFSATLQTEVRTPFLRKLKCMTQLSRIKAWLRKPWRVSTFMMGGGWNHVFSIGR